MTTPHVERMSPLADRAEAPSLIETQLPVSKLSKESYKERKANNSQTLTALGKWWGRKPLVLVRAALLGLLLPTSDDPAADRQTFLSLMTMDDDGLRSRIRGTIAPADVHTHLTASERQDYFNGTKWKKSVSSETKGRLQSLAFLRMSYDERLKHCVRPEEVDGPSPSAWDKINLHLDTTASCLPELIRQLGERRFGRVPRVGDAFSGGGSIPFEAARIGCEAFGSDLSPVASLLTWGTVNIVGGGKERLDRAHDLQNRVYAEVTDQVEALRIERGDDGWIPDAYLYCLEVRDPTTGWMLPLAPSWVIGEGTKTVARLIPDVGNKRFDIEIQSGVSAVEMASAKAEGTAKSGIVCPVDVHGAWLPAHNRIATPFEELRGATGLRRWNNDDVVPREGDVLQERLYCIRWVNPASGKREYRSVTEADVQREVRVLALLGERFSNWQSKGYIPSAVLEPGDKTDEPVRTRGWTHWHHLFNPRQLLVTGLFAETMDRVAEDEFDRGALLIGLARLADRNSRLCRWNSNGANEKSEQTFYNQALNPLANYGCRPVAALKTSFDVEYRSAPIAGSAHVELGDARSIESEADIWITDPGYADMVNYEELSEFFLAWWQKALHRAFPHWYVDSKRALAVAGKDEDFRKAMVECYRRFSHLMPDNGLQVVMFTHQNAEIWSDMALILWAAGLRVSQAWTIATETGGTGVRQGNYVQGTVLLVLRKRLIEKRGDMADVYPDLQAEVQRQMQTMLELDPKDDPNFGDSDYQLAAYAAALRVLTEYSAIDEIDVERELYKERGKGERSPLTGIIERAVKIASDYLVPDGLDRGVWKKLSAEERLYMKGVEIESHGEYREGVYQEFARGFGVGEYHSMLGSTAANQTRLKTPSEFKGKDLGGQGFAGSLTRQLLYGIWVTASNDDRDPRPARTYLKQELPDYWDQRPMVIELLRYLAEKPRTASPSRIVEGDIEEHAPMAHWAKDADAARLLLGSIENDSI